MISAYRSLLLFVPLFCSSGAAVSQSLAERVAVVHRAATWSEDGLAGDGADWLAEAGRAAEFTVVGESHGNAETCRLTEWLMAELQRAGYTAFAMETGPCTTRHAVEIVKKKGVDGVVQFNRQYPFAIAFLYHREEIEVVAKAASLGMEVWGLDQEFMGSPRFLLSQIVEQSKGDAGKQLASKWLERATEGFAHFAKTGDQSKAFFSIARPEDYRELGVALAEEEPATRELLAELAASARIYGHYAQKRYYQNNYDRIQLMKRHFADRLEQAGRDAKVLLKFGAAHAGRGYSPFDQLDVGNHAAEMAVARGGDSFHVQVLARRATNDAGETRDFLAELAHFAPFGQAMREDSIGVFDLRALRPYAAAKSVKASHPELHRLVFAFDALVIVPEFTASEAVIPLPKR